MKLTKRQLRKIIKEEFGRVLSEETGLLFELSRSELLSGQGGYKVQKVLTRGRGIFQIDPRSVRGHTLGRNWAPLGRTRGPTGHSWRFRWVDPGDVQDKIQLIEKEMLGIMWEFVSSEVAEKVERGKEQADASDEGRGVARSNYWMNFVDGIKRPDDPKVNEKLLGRFVNNPDQGKSNDYIVMGSYQGPEGTRIAENIFIVFKTIGKIYFVDSRKGFVEPETYYFLAVVEN